MSFSSETKFSVMNDLPAKTCCRKSLLMGLLTYSSIFSREKIKFITEISAASDAVMSLLSSLYGINGNLYVSQKKKSREDEENSSVINSYKITVSDRRDIAKMNADLPSGAVSLYRINKPLISGGCSKCRAMFLRGAFVSAGTVSRPESSFHLEISTPYKNLANDTTELLKEEHLEPKITLRGSDYVVYFKKCDEIAGFLSQIGASSASFKFIDESIIRESRSHANRAVNCDTANIRKTVSAATEVMSAVKYLKDNRLLDKLPEDLRRTAELRYDNPQASLSELADMSVPKLTKSGLNHRIKRILDIAQKYKKESKQ